MYFVYGHTVGQYPYRFRYALRTVPSWQERSERGQMAEAVLGGVEEEYRVAPGCIGMRLVSK